MMVAKVMDVITRLPGCAGDAVFLFTQVKMEDSTSLLDDPKIRMSRYLDTSTKTQIVQIIVQYGRSNRSSWAKSVRSSFSGTIWERQCEKFRLGHEEKFQIENACSLLRECVQNTDSNRMYKYARVTTHTEQIDHTSSHEHAWLKSWKAQGCTVSCSKKIVIHVSCVITCRTSSLLNFLVRYTFIQMRKNSSKNTFIQKRFHPMTLSSKNGFVQWHFLPKPVSSNDSFIPNHFHPTLNPKP